MLITFLFFKFSYFTKVLYIKGNLYFFQIIIYLASLRLHRTFGHHFNYINCHSIKKF